MIPSCPNVKFLNSKNYKFDSVAPDIGHSEGAKEFCQNKWSTDFKSSLKSFTFNIV